MRRLVMALLSILLFPRPGTAATIRVPADQPTIQAGIDAAVAGDTVLVACGTYYEFGLDMMSGVVLQSETGEPECVVIDAQRQGRVLACENVDETTRIQGITFRRGLATGSAPDDRGGGIYCSDATPRIIDCVFDDNQSTYVGGGMFCKGDALVEGCKFIGNNGPPWGGGFFCWQSSPTLSNCQFVANRSLWGGGMYCYQGASPLITGCTFYGNEAVFGDGGGIACFAASSPTLANTIIAGNGGNAVYCDDPGSLPSLSCCDLFGNGGDWVGCIEDQYGVSGNISEDPLFCDTMGGDLHLYGSSPCTAAHQPECGLIGALDIGCGATATEQATWGAVKSMFR